MSRIKIIPEKCNFIDKISNYLLATSGNEDLSDRAVVFPGARPAIFLRRSLSEKIDGPFMPPDIFSIDRFMEHLFKKKREEKMPEKNIDLLFLLFRAIRESHLEPESELSNLGESLDDFILWGDRILSSLEEIEVEGTPKRDVEIRTQYEENIPDWAWNFWHNLSEIDEKFRDLLKENGLTFRGEVYRYAAENIEEIFPEISFKKIIFAGFNALNFSEEMVMRCLLERDRAEFFIQSDCDFREEPPDTSEYYHHFKLVKKKWNDLEFEILDDENTSRKQTDINIIQAFDTHSEVLKVREIMDKIEEKDENVAIVIPESPPLIPVIHEVVSAVDAEFNITLQYPVKRTSIYGLIETVFSLQKTKETEDRVNRYYVKDYLKLITHPYIKTVYAGGNGEFRNLIYRLEKSLVNENRENMSVFFSLEEIENLEKGNSPAHSCLQDIHDLFIRNFEDPRTVGEVATFLKKSMSFIYEKTSLADHPLTKQFLSSLLGEIGGIEDSIFAHAIFESLDNVLSFVKNYLKNTKTPFKGKPLRGVQIMGLLETRSLNFDKVIILDVNEGIVPAVEKYNPMLPQNFRRDLNLPDYRDRESIYAYNFFRLISGASEVHLMYREGKLKETDKSIKSRFIERIIWNREKMGEKIEKRNLLFRVEGGLEKQISEKDYRAGLKAIERLNEKTYTATSLNTYITCPLKFYYKYGLNLTEREEIEESVEPGTIGNFVHDFLGEYYKRFKGKSIRIERDDFMEELDNKLELKFNQGGGELIIGQIIREALKKYLDYERERLSDKNPVLIGTEKRLCSQIKSAGKTYKLYARIDRIDRTDDGYSIIDYKTGNPSSPNKSELPGDNLSREIIKKQIKDVQLPLYTYMFARKADEETVSYEEIVPEIVCIRNLDNGYILNTDYMDVFINAIKFLLNEITDPGIPFIPDEDNSRYGHCKYCPYNMICPAL